MLPPTGIPASPLVTGNMKLRKNMPTNDACERWNTQPSLHQYFPQPGEWQSSGIIPTAQHSGGCAVAFPSHYCSQPYKASEVPTLLLATP